VNYDNETVIVKTFAHNMRKMNFDLPRFFKKYVSPRVCRDIDIKGMNFFVADAKLLYENLVELARKNITIYKKIHYKWNRIL
jgi:hypothetical protein